MDVKDKISKEEKMKEIPKTGKIYSSTNKKSEKILVVSLSKRQCQVEE